MSCTCGCCEPLASLTPLQVENRPALSAIAYRIGTYASFRESMLEEIVRTPELAPLTTRRDDDYTVTILDLWAAVADVLTFYQERYANEAFLRTATWRDPNLRNPYVMNWSAGFQYQMASTWVVNLTYQGTAGVGLERNWNINQIPLSIALGGNRALQDTVFQAQQNYLMYPQFGTINLLSNFNHNTWHSGNITLEKRYGKGLVLNASYNYSKSLSNSDQLGYYNREGKARTSYDQENSFGAYVIYELPVGKGQKWLNRGGVLNAVLGGWKVDVSENILSGIPLSVGSSGSPNRYLTASPVNALVPVEQVKIDHWSMGNRFPTAAQNPYFDINAFAYPASYTVGSLGARVLQAPGIWWMQCFATKSWKVLDERLKLSLRLDGHNLPWKRPNLSAPNTTYNLNSVTSWARFTGVLGDFSNFGTGQANVQASIRAEF